MWQGGGEEQCSETSTRLVLHYMLQQRATTGNRDDTTNASLHLWHHRMTDRRWTSAGVEEALALSSLGTDERVAEEKSQMKKAWKRKFGAAKGSKTVQQKKRQTGWKGANATPDGRSRRRTERETGSKRRQKTVDNRRRRTKVEEEAKKNWPGRWVKEGRKARRKGKEKTRWGGPGCCCHGGGHQETGGALPAAAEVWKGRCGNIQRRHTSETDANSAHMSIWNHDISYDIWQVNTHSF